MSKIPFIKMHGCGNDYIYVDTSRYPIANPAKAAILWSDRHKGIGSDGLVLIDRSPVTESDFSMRIFNADGSEGMMCGNACRCIGKYLFERGMTTKTSIRLLTLSGVKKLQLHVDDNNIVESVTVDMGEPVLEDETLYIRSRGMDKGTFVSMGNPHFVTFQEMDDPTIDALGPLLECHRLFPRKTNVEFCRVIDGKIYIRVFERGAGWTLACGTGACASTVAAALNGLVPYDTPVDVHLPGGWLKITVDKDLKYVLMEGPAELVFEGELNAEYTGC